MGGPCLLTCVRAIADWIVTFLDEYHWTIARDVRVIHVGIMTLCGALSMIGLYWPMKSLEDITIDLFFQAHMSRYFAFSIHLFPYRWSGTLEFLSSLNLLLYIGKLIKKYYLLFRHTSLIQVSKMYDRYLYPGCV